MSNTYDDILLPREACNRCDYCGNHAVRFIWTDLYPHGEGYLAACEKCTDPHKGWTWTPAVSIEVGDFLPYGQHLLCVENVTAERGLMNVTANGIHFIFGYADPVRVTRNNL